METGTVKVTARTIMGDVQHSLQFDAGVATRDATASFIASFSLPSNVPWQMRTPEGEFLDEAAPIGSHVAGKEPELAATLIPRTHLGGR